MTNYNSISMSMKLGFILKISKANNYNKAKLKLY